MTFSGAKKFGNGKFQKPQGKFQNGQGKFQNGKFQKGAPGKPIKTEGQANPVAPEKVDWTKFKQEKKDLRMKRKVAKSGFDQIHEAKQIYEKLKWYVHKRGWMSRPSLLLLRTVR